MNKKQEDLERLIRSLKKATPVLNDPNSLTNSIMEHIGKQSKHQIAPLLIWTRTALSTAAVLMFGLFVFQQTEAENSTASTSVEPVIEIKIEEDSTCMQLLGSEHLNYLQSYLCYMQQNSIDNELFKTYPKQKN